MHMGPWKWPPLCFQDGTGVHSHLGEQQKEVHLESCVLSKPAKAQVQGPAGHSVESAPGFQPCAHWEPSVLTATTLFTEGQVFG